MVDGLPADDIQYFQVAAHRGKVEHLKGKIYTSVEYLSIFQHKWTPE